MMGNHKKDRTHMKKHEQTHVYHELVGLKFGGTLFSNPYVFPLLWEEESRN